MAHIRRRDTKSGSRYDVRYRTADGSVRTKTIRRKADAERFRSTTEVELRPSSRARDAAYLRSQILPVFGSMPLSSIDHLMIRSWVAEISNRRKASTVHKIVGILRKVLSDAVDAGLIARNPSDRVKLPRIERREMRFLTPADLADLADAIDPRYRAAVILAGYGGLRAGEMFGLRVHRVDAARQHVHIAEIATHVQGHLYVGPPKTRASHRTVPILRFVADALADHIESIGGDGDDLVFPAPQGGHVRLDLWRRRTWAPGVKAAGLAHLRPHDLRHTAVALWIAAGASPKEIAARAGHTSVVTVLDRYGHLLPGHEEKVNDALDEMARVARPTLQIVSSDDVVEDVSRENPQIPRDIRAMNHSGRESAASEEAADQEFHEWAMGDLNPRPLPCEGSALAS